MLQKFFLGFAVLSVSVFLMVQYVAVFGALKVEETNGPHFVVASFLLAGLSLGLWIMVTATDTE